MRKVLGILLLCLSALTVRAQHDTDLTIGVIVPEQPGEVDSQAARLLATRLQGVMGAAGISSALDGGMILYPEVNVIDRQTVEGGLRNMALIEVELSLFVKQVMTGTVFGSCSKTFKGSGRTPAEAMRNAMTGIKPRDEVYVNFLQETKGKIVRYYLENKANLMRRARQLSTTQQYEEAIALLMTYPPNLEGADEVWQTAVEVYKQYQGNQCAQLILQAESALSLQDYGQAVSFLAQVDPESPCYPKALALLKQVDKSIRAEQQAEKAFVEKLIKQEFDLKQQRIEAIRAIGTAFVSSLPQVAKAFK